MDLEEHYDNTDDMYCEIADRLEAVEAAAPAASIGAIATHLGAKKDSKAKGSGGGAKVCRGVGCCAWVAAAVPAAAALGLRIVCAW